MSMVLWSVIDVHGAVQYVHAAVLMIDVHGAVDVQCVVLMIGGKFKAFSVVNQLLRCT